MDFKEQLGARIASARGFNRLGQNELAKIIGVSKQTISNWENGRRTPDADLIRKLCETLGCTSDYLLGLTDSFIQKRTHQ